MAETGRVAVVTGGNRGIGFEVSRQLGKAGYRVVLTGRNEAKAQAAAGTLKGEGSEVVGYPLDVTKADSVAALAKWVGEQFGRVDALINNAGIMIDKTRVGGSLVDMPVETLQETLETNLYGPLRLIHAFLPMMKEQGYGRVVNVSSQLGSLAAMDGGYQAYRISKTALNAVTRILAAETRGTNILVNSACPGWVKTDMGGPDAPGTAEQGADTIVWLATLPDGGQSGGFFQDRRPLAW